MSKSIIRKTMCVFLSLISILCSSCDSDQLKNDNYHVTTQVYVENSEVYMDVTFQSMIEMDTKDVVLSIYMKMLDTDEKLLVYEKYYEVVKAKSVQKKETQLIDLEGYELIKYEEGESPTPNYELIVEIYENYKPLY